MNSRKYALKEPFWKGYFKHDSGMNDMNLFFTLENVLFLTRSIRPFKDTFGFEEWFLESDLFEEFHLGILS